VIVVGCQADPDVELASSYESLERAEGRILATGLDSGDRGL